MFLYENFEEGILQAKVELLQTTYVLDILFVLILQTLWRPSLLLSNKAKFSTRGKLGAPLNL